MADEETLEEIAAEDQEGSPDLAVVLERTMSAVAERMHTAAPGIATSVNAVAGTVSAQQAVTRAGEEAEPEVPEVPVLQIRSSLGGLRVPLAAGDPVLLVHANRSLDEWARSDGRQVLEAEDPRAHDPSDAMAIPAGPGAAGATAFTAVVLDGDDVRLGDETAVEGVILGTTAVAALQAFCTALLSSIDPMVVSAATALQATLSSWLSIKVKVA